MPKGKAKATHRRGPWVFQWGKLDGWTDGWVDGWMGGWRSECSSSRCSFGKLLGLGNEIRLQLPHITGNKITSGQFSGRSKKLY